MAEDNTKTLIIRGVPEQTHRALRQLALDDGCHMSDLVRAEIDSLVNRRERKTREQGAA